MHTQQIPPDVTIGHVHLRVSDLNRATDFYRDVLGFNVVVDGEEYSLPMRLLAAGNYHHHIALNTFLSEGGSPAPVGHTGLHHFALLYSSQQDLAMAVLRLFDLKYPIDEARDHGGTVSVYLQDPDGNGIELYYDRPRSEWFDERGNPVMRNDAFDPRKLVTDLVLT